MAKKLLHSKYAFLIIGLMLFVSPWILAQNNAMGPTELELAKLMQDAAFKNGDVAFLAVNLDNGKVIAEHNSQRSMIPASIQKLITTGTTLEKLGAEHSFETTFYHTGSISDGTLNGNLIIEAKGDPTLGSRFFSDSPASVISYIKAQLAEKEIKTVNGKIILDLTYYNQHNTPRGMLWEDMGNYFGASPTSLMWKDNMIKVNLRSAQAGSPVSIADQTADHLPYQFDIQVKASTENRDNAWFFSAPGGNTIYAKGTIPEKRPSFGVKISNPNPQWTFVQDLKKGLNWTNVEVEYNFEPVEYVKEELFAIQSPTLAKIIKETNTHSVNLFADALCSELDPNTPFKDIENGVETMEQFLTEKKVSTRGLRLLDGSGVSPMNRMTAQTMVDFLGAMYRSQNFDTYFESIPVAGQTGTVKYYFKGTKAEGNLRAKSGTMAGTRNYAGYVTNKYQENIAFCVMMNDYDEDRKKVVMDRVVLLLNALIED